MKTSFPTCSPPPVPFPENGLSANLVRDHLRTVTLVTRSYHAGKRGRGAPGDVDIVEIPPTPGSPPRLVETVFVPDLRTVYRDLFGERKIKRREDIHRAAVWHYLRSLVPPVGRLPDITPHVMSMNIDESTSNDPVTTWIHTIVTVTPDKPTP